MATSVGRGGKRLAAWWGALTPRWRGVLTWALPLLVAHLLVLVAFWFNATHGASLARDRWTLRMAGATEVYCLVVMVIGARRWDGLSMGLTLFFAANAPVLLRVLGRVGATPGDVELNLIRSYYQVSAPILVVCLTAWAIGSKFGTRHGPMPNRTEGIEREVAELRTENAVLRAACAEQGIVVESPDDRLLYEGPDRRGLARGRRASDR